MKPEEFIKQLNELIKKGGDALDYAAANLDETYKVENAFVDIQELAEKFVASLPKAVYAVVESPEPEDYQDDCDAMVAKWYGAELLDDFVDEIWDSEITIKNERIAEYVGRTKIAEFYQTTCAKDVEEFISECSTGFSGTPIDGSPFDRDASDDYAREYWETHHVED